MLKVGELKQGDIIMVNDDGVMREGTVSKISHEDNQAYVNNGIQEFWYDPGEMFPLPVDENQLMKLGFQKQESESSVKYMKGPFRLVTPKKGDFSNIEMWYREDRRHFNAPLSVHELQNLHREMTKIGLESA
ncbi:MAG: hypothetical protein IT214_02575 [Chitinophagaceae bacterium]|jgi:hypothetical protein|nr:hypothetical protein [Chitinophagaceae bacterium]OQY94123.1 MAG: hypothetical protein B6D37_09425 [Sphingobacteriales bacterium UTBCD1]